MCGGHSCEDCKSKHGGICPLIGYARRRENYRKERREKLCKDCDSYMTDSSGCHECPKNQRKPRK